MSQQAGTSTGYFVEARSKPGRPVLVGETLVTETWRRLDFQSTPPDAGVRNDMWPAEADSQGVLTYVAARALLATAASRNPDLEFRLVRVRFEYKWEIHEEGVTEPESFDWFRDKDLRITPRGPTESPQS